MEQKIKCSIVRNLCKISENTRGYTIEANLVSWNDAAPKLDIRQWSPDHIPCKGVTLTEAEGMLLYTALKDYFKKEECEV